MAKIISVANQKGGVGKTTTTINLSASLAHYGMKTLVVDIDPQSNSSSGLNHRNKDFSIYDVLIGTIPPNAGLINDILPNLSLIPANINLVGAEIEILDMPNREYVMTERLKQISDQFDFILIDCPPSLGILTLNALTASDSVVIPVQCEYFALEGLGQLLNTINIVKQRFNKKLSIEGVLLTMYDSRLKLSELVAAEVNRYFEEKVYNTRIHRNVRISEAPSYGKPVMYYDSYASGAQNYLDLAKEFLERNNVAVSA
ncbi:MAG: ParA family protein [Ignavibacteriaceae bacterium]|nr:ParA family protein [Ignavibacteriaceae bacterium]